MIKKIFTYIGYFMAFSGLVGVISLNVMSINSKDERAQIITTQKEIKEELKNKATKEAVENIQTTQLKLIDAVGKHIAKDSSSIKQDVVNFYTLFRKEFQIEFNKEQEIKRDKIDSIKYIPNIIMQQIK
jgi:hypothetical protein